MGSGSRTDCTYSNFIGCKIRILFYSFFKQFTFHSVCDEWAELHVLSAQLRCVFHLFPVHPGDVLIQGKPILYPCCRTSRDQSPSPPGNNEYGTGQSNRCKTVVTWISQTASSCTLLLGVWPTSSWFKGTHPVQWVRGLSFSSRNVSSAAGDAGGAVLFTVQQPVVLVCTPLCLCACVEGSLVGKLLLNQAGAHYWSKAPLLCRLDGKHNKKVESLLLT